MLSECLYICYIKITPNLNISARLFNYIRLVRKYALFVAKLILAIAMLISRKLVQNKWNWWKMRIFLLLAGRHDYQRFKTELMHKWIKCIFLFP